MAGEVHCMSRVPHPGPAGPAMLLCGVLYYTLPPPRPRFIHQDLPRRYGLITCEACKAELTRQALEPRTEDRGIEWITGG